jgi:hypothetical protein
MKFLQSKQVLLKRELSKENDWKSTKGLWYDYWKERSGGHLIGRSRRPRGYKILTFIIFSIFPPSFHHKKSFHMSASGKILFRNCANVRSNSLDFICSRMVTSNTGDLRFWIPLKSSYRNRCLSSKLVFLKLWRWDRTMRKKERKKSRGTHAK